MTGRRASDWLHALPRPEAETAGGGDRSSQDRRTGDRRAPRRPIDPQFAATLLNQVLPPSAEAPAAYPQRAPRAGFLINVRT